MTYNEEAIRKYINYYKTSYKERFNEEPHCWFTYLKWLASCTPSGCFEEHEIRLAEELLNN